MKASENQMEQGKTGERIVASLGPTRRFPAGSSVLLAFPALLPQGTRRGDEPGGPATLLWPAIPFSFAPTVTLTASCPMRAIEAEEIKTKYEN